MSEATIRVLSSAAVDVLEQLFINGPCWDGNLVSKSGRSELVEVGLAFRRDGWQSLTQEGLRLAISADVKARTNQRWYRKQQDI